MQGVVRVDAVTCQAGRADPAGEAALQLAQVLNSASSAGAAFAQIYSVSVEATPGCLGGLLGKKSTYQQVDLAVCAPRLGASAPSDASEAPLTGATTASTGAPAVGEAAPSSDPLEAFSRIPGINPSAGGGAGSNGGIQGKWVLAAVVGGLVLVTLLSNLFSSRPAAPSAAALPAPAIPVNASPAAVPAASAGPQALNSAWFGTWRSENQRLVATFSANLVKEQITRTEGGKSSVDTYEYPWVQDIAKAGNSQPYSAYMVERATPADLSKWLEERLKPSVDYGPPEAAPARRALSQISAGTYKVVIAESPETDCIRAKYLVDGNRMLRWGECKYGAWVDLLTRQ
jgi:hypothetical protein